MVAGTGVGEGELVVACGVGGDGGYENFFSSVRFVERNGCLCDRGAVGGEGSGDRDVAPDELLSGGDGGGDGRGDGDIRYGEFIAHRGVVRRAARVRDLESTCSRARLGDPKGEAAPRVRGRIADAIPKTRAI